MPKPVDDLLAEIRGNKARRGPQCGVHRALDALDDDLRGGFLQAINGDPETYQGTAISRAFKARGQNVSPNTVQHHRRGECGCQQTA